MSPALFLRVGSVAEVFDMNGAMGDDRQQVLCENLESLLKGAEQSSRRSPARDLAQTLRRCVRHFAFDVS
jgi:hypothetical protein